MGVLGREGEGEGEGDTCTGEWVCWGEREREILVGGCAGERGMREKEIMCW